MKCLALIFCILITTIMTGCVITQKQSTTKTFVSTKCNMVCNNTSCEQVCVTVDGTLK